MADLDPFGRRKDENPLASLSWLGDESASAVAPEPEIAQPVDVDPPSSPGSTPVQVPAGTAATPPHVRGRSQSRPSRSRGSGVTRLLRAGVILAVLIAVLGGTIGALVDIGVERADRFARELSPPETPSEPRSGSQEGRFSDRARAPRPARGLSSDSLLRPAAFGKALARLRNRGYGRLTNLRVAADRVDATLLTKGGRLRHVQIVPGGAVRVITTSASGFAGARTMTLKGISASAPSRLTRSAAGRLKLPAGRVDYLVLSEFAGARVWNIYFKSGQIFSADARGRITRRVS